MLIVEIEVQPLVILSAQKICLQSGLFVQFISKSLGLVGDTGDNNDEPQPGGPCSLLRLKHNP